MKDTAKKVLLNTLVLTLGFSSFSLIAKADDYKVSIEQQTALSDNSDFLITERDDLSKISSKVISVDLIADKEPKNYTFKALGNLSNRSELYLKNIKIRLKIMDKNRKVIEQINVDPVESLGPGQNRPFAVEKFITTEASPFDVRAEAVIDSMDGASLYQIAQWFVQGKSENLKFWDVPFDERYFQNDSWLRNSAINILLTIDKSDKHYDKAIDMLNELHYTEALIALSANDYNSAFVHLTAMDPSKIYGDKAEKLIDLYRPKVVYEKAKPMIAKKQYINVIPLLRSIPPGTEYYDMAQADLKNIYFYFRHRSLWANLPTPTGSEDQKKVLQLMESKPELILNDSPSKNIVTWVFPDYSRFNFDKDGKLLDYKVYPLF